MCVISYGFYDYFNSPPDLYTGSETQPDVIHVFTKSEEGSLKTRSLLPITNVIDFIPVLSSFDSVLGIFIAAKRIFQELSQTRFNAEDPHLNECWNAVKNLFRRLVALVPLVGNVALLVFEANRNLVLISKIEQELQNKNDQFGVAIDGKIVFILGAEPFKAFVCSLDLPNVTAENINEMSLETLEYFVKKFLEIEEKANGTKEKVCNILQQIPKLVAFHTAQIASPNFNNLWLRL